MDRVLDNVSERILFHLENETRSGYLHPDWRWDNEWEYQWTSAWNYDEIYMWYHPKYCLWVWTDGNKGNTLV